MFYTYYHTRNDTNAVFYVGKGSSWRMGSSKSRNRYWQNIVNKHGFTAHLAAKWQTEEEAFEHERFLIECFKDIGCPIVNMTVGGDGVRGFKATPEQREANRQRGIAQMTDEMRARISQSARKNATEEARRAASERTSALWSDENFAAKLKAAAVRRWSNPEERQKQSERGKKYSLDPAVRSRLSTQSVGKQVSQEARAKISAKNKGKIVSEETKARMRAAWIVRKTKKSSSLSTTTPEGAHHHV